MDLDDLFKEFEKKKIIVLGDVMIDAYLYGGVNRISPEAPVPIINFRRKEQRLGGAANVALNLLSLGANVSIATVIGNDDEAKELTQLFIDEGVSTDAILYSDNRQTTVKTRVIGNHQQLMRIDNEQTDDISTDEELLLLEKLENLLKQGQDAIILQDYNKGVLTEHLIKKVIDLAKKYDTITTVDPKLKNFLAYKEVTLFKPNLKELSEGVQMNIDFENDINGFNEAVEILNASLQPEILFVTLSQYGVYIQDQNTSIQIPAHKRTIHDVSGAGDTVISVATLCLTANIKTEAVARIANLAGGIVCEYPGVVAIDKEQLLKEAKKLAIELV